MMIGRSDEEESANFMILQEAGELRPTCTPLMHVVRSFGFMQPCYKAHFSLGEGGKVWYFAKQGGEGGGSVGGLAKDQTFVVFFPYPFPYMVVTLHTST